jgi:hypothetical protein
MNATTYVIGAALLLPFLSSCSADSAPSCDDPAVMTSASVKLTEWLDQKMVNGGFAHANATLVVGISASAPIGDLQGTKQCRAQASAGFREPDGTLHATEPFSLGFLLAIGQDGQPQITLNEGSLLSDGGAFDATGSLLVKEAQRKE